jgi:signal transduction histidine kinase
MPTAGPASFVDVLESLPELADALRSRIDQIVARWEDLVHRVISAAGKLAGTPLRNDWQTALRELADFLASTDSATMAALVESSRPHAGLRFHEQYDLRELIIEYRLLRRIIVEEVESALHPRGRSLSVAEQVSLHMGIDAMLQGAVVAFVDHQKDRLRAVAQRAAATAEQAKDAVAVATAQAMTAIAVATEQAKVAAATTSEQAKDAAWATSEQARRAVAVATEQAMAAVAVATEQAKVAAATISEQARDAAWATSRQATAIAAATSEQARDAAWATSEQARAAAAAASQVKDHFLAVLSHELRNPLTPVLATTSLLQLDERFDEETRAHLEVIRRNAELEARLIDDLLDVTRISRGKVELDRHPVELGTILRHAVEVCQADIEARGLHFEVVIKDPPHMVDADAGRLQQVFWNILKNAVKFTPRGGRVEMRAGREDGSVAVEVNDSGLGMEPEALTRVFNAFEQAEISVTRQFGGLGLGLAISKALVEMHGGTITAASPGKGKGATFRVRLPLIAALAPVERAPAPAAAAPQARCVRVLLVEDHGDTARILARILRGAGHTVQTAGDVASALELAGNAEFDLLLSDMGLPDGSGMDLMKELRRRGNPLPGIALSGYGQEEDVRVSREAGFSQHLLKPVTAQRLLAIVAGL